MFFIGIGRGIQTYERIATAYLHMKTRACLCQQRLPSMFKRFSALQQLRPSIGSTWPPLTHFDADAHHMKAGRPPQTGLTFDILVWLPMPFRPNPLAKVWVPSSTHTSHLVANDAEHNLSTAESPATALRTSVQPGPTNLEGFRPALRLCIRPRHTNLELFCQWLSSCLSRFKFRPRDPDLWQPLSRTPNYTRACMVYPNLLGLGPIVDSWIIVIELRQAETSPGDGWLSEGRDSMVQSMKFSSDVSGLSYLPPNLPVRAYRCGVDPSNLPGIGYDYVWYDPITDAQDDQREWIDLIVERVMEVSTCSRGNQESVEAHEDTEDTTRDRFCIKPEYIMEDAVPTEILYRFSRAWRYLIDHGNNQNLNPDEVHVAMNDERRPHGPPGVEKTWCDERVQL